MIAMLTTIDNPFDPFEEFDQWYAYDVSRGHNCCGYLAKIAKTSDALSDNLNHQEIERAIDEICEFNINGLYKKVYKKE